MDSTNVKTGFFAALSGSCRGTDIFLRLKDQSPVRALLHMLFLLAVCGVAVVLIQNISSNGRFDETAAVFKATFGGVSVDRQSHQIRPLLRPEDSRSMLLPGGGIVTYVPGGLIPALPGKSSVADFNYLVYWFPGEFVAASKMRDGELRAFVWRPGDFIGSVFGSQVLLNSSTFEKMLSEAADRNAKLASGGNGSVDFQADDLILVMRYWGSLLGFALFTLGGFIQIALYIAIFVGMFYLTGARPLRSLKLRNLIVCAIYAGFPAIMVGSAFPAFELPVLSFGSAYVIGMVIYLLSVVNRIERAGQSSGKEEGSK